MQILKKSNLFFVFGFSFLIIMFSLFFSVSVVQATVTPTLSLTATGDGDSVQLNITGDPNSSVLFAYIKSGSGQQIIPIGTTSSNGTLTTTLSTSNYGISASSSVYILVGGLNGVQSSSVTWPAVTSLLSSSNMLSLSQTGLVLPVGQTSTIIASNLNGSSLYLSSNSNPQIANFNISGSQISVLANGYGTTTGTVCLINNTSNCGSVYVIVQNGSAQALTFSQSSISLYSGQSVAIQISGGSGSYSVLSNAIQNGGVVTSSITGSIITLGTTSTTGSSSVTVCSTDMTSCGIINVTIGSASSTTAVSFSQPSPTVTVGQNLNISIYGPSSSLFYVSSNSPSGIVQANLSGTILTLLGITNGTSTISICASSSNCGSLVVTVNSNSSTNGGNITLSQDSISLTVGQNANITISGGSMPYNASFSSNSIFQATVNSNILTVYGIGVGSSSLSICSNGHCSSLTINILAQGSTISSLPAGCYTTTGFSQTTGLSCSSVTTTTTTTATPYDCIGTLYSISTGQACPASTVNSATSTIISDTSSSTSSSQTTTASTYKFIKSIALGSKGTEVSELQTKLKALGFYKGKIDGGFGGTTESAVKAFQKAHGLPQVGNVGPKTRALLNK